MPITLTNNTLRLTTNSTSSELNVGEAADFLDALTDLLRDPTAQQIAYSHGSLEKYVERSSHIAPGVRLRTTQNHMFDLPWSDAVALVLNSTPRE